MQDRNLPKKYLLRLEDKALFDRMKKEGMASFRQEILALLPPGTTWDQNTFEITTISEDEQQFKHYNDRITSIFDGVKFLLDHIKDIDENFEIHELYKQKLLTFLGNVTEECRQKLREISNSQNPNIRNDISNYQNSIADYTSYVLSVLRSQFDLPIKKVGIKRKIKDEMREYLARAEEFALAKKTKPAIITITSFQISKDQKPEYMAMIDKPENPFDNFTDNKGFRKHLLKELEDLKLILTTNNLAIDYGYSYPTWYTVLNDEKKQEVNDLLLKFNLNEEADRSLIFNGVISTAFESIRGELRAIKTKNTLNYPDWFKVLKNFEQKMLQGFLLDVDIDHDLGTTINAISSKLRIIPVPSNYSTHTLVTHMHNGREMETVVHSSEKRSSHAASRDVTDKNVRIDHAERNVFKMLDDLIREKLKELGKNQGLLNKTEKTVIHIPILYQTLITPFKEPDASLDQDKAVAVKLIRKQLELTRNLKENGNIEIKFDLISTNHPLNYGKYKDPTTAGSLTASEISKLLSTITGRTKIYGSGLASIRTPFSKELLKEDIRKRNPQVKEEHLDLLAQACIDLAKGTTDRRMRSLFSAYRELYLSSLEQMVTSFVGGGSMGSCVSGKDRKAIEIAHTDAMKIFYTKYGRLPPLHRNSNDRKTETDKAIFAKIFAEIYCTKHQQALAGQNAPGSFGTKTPGMYLPERLREAVKEWYRERDKKGSPYQGYAQLNILGEDNRRASNNDLNHISTMFPTIIKRVSKLFKSKPAPHQAPEELVWKKTSMENRDIYQINEADFVKTTQVALDGLAIYEAQVAKKANQKGLFSRTSEAKRELKRIHMYQNLLGEASQLSNYQKSILLYSIMGNKEDWVLQNALLYSMKLPSGEAARFVLSSYIKNEVNNSLEQVPANQKKLRYDWTISNVNQTAVAILKHIETKNPEAKNIQSILQTELNKPYTKVSLQEGQKPLSKKKVKEIKEVEQRLQRTLRGLKNI